MEKYVERMSSLEDKYDMYCEMGLWRKAGDIAVKLKDSAKIVEVTAGWMGRDGSG